MTISTRVGIRKMWSVFTCTFFIVNPESCRGFLFRVDIESQTLPTWSLVNLGKFGGYPAFSITGSTPEWETMPLAYRDYAFRAV
jgi:hypothetical protein